MLVEYGFMLRPRCKYQIFISSTFTDLSEEREYVSWEILKMRHIPAGMESFTARTERGLKTIQRIIDDSDYYILLLGGRYGSLDEKLNKSWTHYEYDYAISKGIPILAFVRDWGAMSADKVDTDRIRINEFRDLVRNSLLCSSWKQKEDLASLISTALTAQINDDIEDGKPRPGWFRGDALPGPSVEVTDELARLSAENARMRQDIEAARKLADGSSRNAEIEKSANYLRSQQFQPNLNLYELLLMLSDRLALGVDEYDLKAVLQYEINIDIDDEDDKSILKMPGHFIIANAVRIERSTQEETIFKLLPGKLFLTDLGAAIVRDGRMAKETLQQS